MTIDEFVGNFRAFCDNKYGTQNGTAASYANALRYLLAYLHIDQVHAISVGHSITTARLEFVQDVVACIYAVFRLQEHEWNLKIAPHRNHRDALYINSMQHVSRFYQIQFRS